MRFSLCRRFARREQVCRARKAALVGLARGYERVDVVQQLGREKIKERSDYEEAVCSSASQLERPRGPRS